MGTKQIGTAARPATWVQTEREAHEAWSQLIVKAPVAARLMHVLVAHMDASMNAVVASQATLGELLGGIHRNTVRKAIQLLERDRWIEVVQLGGKGGALAYRVNSRVAWGQSREKIQYAAFNARVLASGSEQAEPLEGRAPLRRIPSLMRGEQQLPDGDGQEPPSQPSLEGMEPDLPAILHDDDGNSWEVNQETGEMQMVIGEDNNARD